MLSTLVATDGSGAHPLVGQLCGRTARRRDLADAVHALCTLHGRLPGVIEHAVTRNVLPAAKPWLEEAEQGFTGERIYLARLTSAVGPLPSTPGQAESEAAIAAQRHALNMLAQSDRAGCAWGASAALVLDWRNLRPVLDMAAARFGVEDAPLLLGRAEDTAAAIARIVVSPAIERAAAFGAQQLLAQHRGLWNLLEARASARQDG
jgi:hypothetical protein